MSESHLPVYTRLGILGGGQLGKMISMAASKLGYRTHVFAEHQDDPAVFVTNSATIGNFSDENKLLEFANSVDLAVLEFENIPITSVDTVLCKVPVYPGRTALYIAQNREREKKHIRNLGIEVADFLVVRNHEELRAAIDTLGLPALLKTSQLGYDGKGQYLIKGATDLEEISSLNLNQGYVLEKFVHIREEISLIIAVAKNRNYAFFPVAKNKHIEGILDESVVPAIIEDSIRIKAEEIALTIALSLDVIGLLSVEFFIANDGTLLVNEIAPRPHNSGHWSMDACNVSQFEQLVRAVCNLPLHQVKLLAPCVMKNILGEEILDHEIFSSSCDSVHIYGKKAPKARRKMGHINSIKMQN